MGFYYKDSELIGQRGPIGPAGPDGNAIGTIISFMGTTAPDGYLVCDGTSYAIADYSDLANFFQTQFGIVNHFGGDGTTTFAVPDLRNLFLRGYHGEAEEQLSGEIGEKQEATEHPNVWMSGGNITTTAGIIPKNQDKIIGNSSYRYVSSSNYNASANTEYTSRPVNTAVLFCIKYLKPKTTLVEGGMSESEADSKFLALSGGTMTGTLDMGGQQIHAIDNLSFNPNNISGTAIDPASTKSWIYLEGENKRFSFVSSGVRARLLIGEPTENRDATTKKYVDDQLAALPAAPTKTSELQNDSGFITAEDVPEPDLSGYLPLSGGTMNGDLNMAVNEIRNIEKLGIHIHEQSDIFHYNDTDPDLQIVVKYTGDVYQLSFLNKPVRINNIVNGLEDSSVAAVGQIVPKNDLLYTKSNMTITEIQTTQEDDGSETVEEVDKTYPNQPTIRSKLQFKNIVSHNNNRIANVADPEVDTDAATKGYVDSLASTGSGVTLDTRVANAGLYSTDEIIIGQWIDGKPIYRKVFNRAGFDVPYISQNSTPARIAIDISDLNVDFSTDCRFVTKMSNYSSFNNNVFLFFSGSTNPTYHILKSAIEINLSWGSLGIALRYIKENPDSNESFPYIYLSDTTIIFEYTKTTDSAQSEDLT